MKSSRSALILSLAAFLLAAGAVSCATAGEAKTFAGLLLDPAGPGGNRYVGSLKCSECHQDDYKAWKETLHSSIVQDARANPKAIRGDFSVPDLPFTRDQVEYTIGSHWDQRYLTRLGDDYVVLPRMWSVTTKVWEPYNVWTWKKRPYAKNCAGCHMTWFDPARMTIAEPGVGCESCHGPGGKHVEGDGDKSAIVNPARLSSERYDMICAACHVRGTDPSGEYYFPIGFVPGGDLTPLLNVTVKESEKVAGEENRATILRFLRKWKKDIEASARGVCDQCGIKTGSLTMEQKDKVKQFCFTCHKFDKEGREQLHTHHAATVSLTCFDCHVKKEVEGDTDGTGIGKKAVKGNVHSSSLFRIHIANCYDPDIGKACLACHPKALEEGKEPLPWARETIDAWKGRKPVDH